MKAAAQAGDADLIRYYAVHFGTENVEYEESLPYAMYVAIEAGQVGVMHAIHDLGVDVQTPNDGHFSYSYRMVHSEL